MAGDDENLHAERARLEQADRKEVRWRRWGPYVSDRQWGTVREDYSADGNAWEYFPHEHARSRAYRWGEDGLFGVSDEQCRLCLGLALWNGRDPILKERLFGLTNAEGNHGEDVKEIYYYLDATPTHSYLKALYKYPQSAFPYARLVEENRQRGKQGGEFELMDTGIFDEDRYFDVFVEYAKAGPEDILMRITIHNRGPDEAVIHVLPQLWFRNTWSWTGADAAATKPGLSMAADGSIVTEHRSLGGRRFYVDGEATFLFCENDTNRKRAFGEDKATGVFKDGFHEYLVDGNANAVSSSQAGTKAAAHYSLVVPAGKSEQIRVRLAPEANEQPFGDFDAIFSQRAREADDFYYSIQSSIADKDARAVQRQALAGMIWSKQFFYYDVRTWLQGDPGQPPPPKQREAGRNREWTHLYNADVISMPDKWEYPWYAAWDLAFHCVPLAMIDAEFAKGQLVLLTREWYMHPNGQLPAYEWKFSDVNPPVHAWATWRVFEMDRAQHGGVGDLEFLERVFHKLMLNFTWWVNRKDAGDRNIFQGGFLGLDNIGVFDRSSPLPTGGWINQADGTSWMAMYCLNLMRIALELAQHNHVYEDIASKFFEHFLHIAEAMTNVGGCGYGLWDEEDQFYYDELQLPDGRMIPLRLKSLVGLIPLFAVETIEPETLEKLPDFNRRLTWLLKNRPDLANLVSRWQEPGKGERRLLSLLRGRRMKMLLKRMLNETEFLSDFGVRGLSKEHEATPYVLPINGCSVSVTYQGGESDCDLFGGNSNWRGPIWFPVNYLIVESLRRFHHYYGADFRVECPTGSGNYLTLSGIADELTRRLSRLFLRGENGKRAALGEHSKFQTDPHFRDYPLFYEYFHGDTGRGAGAAHQTGWTGLIATLLAPPRQVAANSLPLESSKN
jgi:hypothetical protein